MTTQAVLNFRTRNDVLKEELFIAALPTLKTEYSIDSTLIEGIDSDMRNFLRPRPDTSGRVDFKLKKEISRHVTLSTSDAQKYPEDFTTPIIRSAYDAELKIKSEMATDDASDIQASLFDAMEEKELGTAYIYRASYRISTKRE